MQPEELLQIIEAFRIAYNEVDEDALGRLLDESVKWGHRNKFGGQGRSDLLRSIAAFSAKTPGRHFGAYGRTAVNGNIVFAEQTWHAVPAAADPAWGWQKGVPVTMETCSLFVIENRKIIEWTDCG